jgi:hypothetical protein
VIGPVLKETFLYIFDRLSVFQRALEHLPRYMAMFVRFYVKIHTIYYHTYTLIPFVTAFRCDGDSIVIFSVKFIQSYKSDSSENTPRELELCYINLVPCQDLMNPSNKGTIQKS